MEKGKSASLIFGKIRFVLKLLDLPVFLDSDSVGNFKAMGFVTYDGRCGGLEKPQSPHVRCTLI